MINKKLFIGISMLLMLTSCSINSRIQKADKKFDLGEYYTAGEMYRAVYPRISAKKKKKQIRFLIYFMHKFYWTIQKIAV